MKMMTNGDMRELKTADIHLELDRVRRHLFDLRAQAVTEKLENPGQLMVAKRTIARLLTVLNQRGETGIEEKQMHLETESAKQRAGKGQGKKV